MTDLERVRETLEDLASYPSKPPKRMRELAEAAIPVIDAHLKEDAEREADRKQFHQAWCDAEAELARLRDRERELSGKVKLAQDVALTWADGDNDAMQAALLGLFLRIYGQAPRNALKETT